MAAWHPGAQQCNRAFNIVRDEYRNVFREGPTFPVTGCDINFCRSVPSQADAYDDCDREPELEALIYASDDDSSDSMQIPPSSPFPHAVYARKRSCPENETNPVAMAKRRRYSCKLGEQFERIQMDLVQKKRDDAKMNFDSVFLKLVAHYTSNGKPIPPKILHELNK